MNHPLQTTPLSFSSFSPPRAPSMHLGGSRCSLTIAKKEIACGAIFLLAMGQFLRSDEPNAAVISIIVRRGVGPSNHHWLVNRLAFRQIASDDPCHALSERELRDNSHSTLATVNHDVSDGSVIIMAPSQNCFKRAVCSCIISPVLIAGRGR